MNTITLASWSTAPYACSQARPCDRPNHNHTGYTTVYADPPQDDGISTEPETPPVYPDPNGYMLLDTLRTRQDQGRCVPCGSAAHRSQECPLIADKLFAR